MITYNISFEWKYFYNFQSISAYCGGRGYNAALNGPFVSDVYATERFAADRIGADCFGAERLAADAYATERFAAPFARPFAGHFGPLAGPYGEIPLSYAASASASHGGALPVASSSPIPANGVSVLSENAIDGALAVAGHLPFLGTVALEGALPTAGSGAVNYGCGNGNVAMLNEDFSGYGYEPMAYGYGRGGLCGCGNRF